MRLLTVATTLLVLAGACFTPEYEECLVSCAVSGDCPDRHSCRDDGFCHEGPADLPINSCVTIDAAPGGSSGADSAPPPCGLNGQDCDEQSTCDILRGQQTECRPVGPGLHLAGCTQPSDCAAGFHCAGELGASVCLPFCDTGAQCSSASCVIPILDALGTPVPDATLCSAGCNPVTGTPCPDGLACAVHRDYVTDTWYTACVASGKVAPGGFCSNQGDCAVGTACESNTCRLYCAGPQDACPSGQLCSVFVGGVEGASWGTCS